MHGHVNHIIYSCMLSQKVNNPMGIVPVMLKLIGTELVSQLGV